jgi:Skp family chaperone for outer membrane proteins
MSRARYLVLVLTVCIGLPALRADDDPGVAPLVKALQDDNPLVRKRAAIALEEFGPRARSATSVLREAAKDDNADVAKAATAALAKIDVQVPLEALLYRLSDKEAEAAVRTDACKELAERFWEKPAAKRALEAVLSDSIINVEAARALETIDGHRKKEPAAAAAGPNGTRIAVLNLAYVAKNCKKFVELQNEMKAELKTFQDRLEPLTKRLEALRKEVMDPTNDAAARATKEQEARNVQQQIQQISEEAKNTLGHKEGEIFQAIYKELSQATSAYALAHDLELVLQYNDATNEVELNSAANIQRKVTSGQGIPLFIQQGAVDISGPIVELLNERHKPGRATTQK